MAFDPARLLLPRILIVDDERQIHASIRLRIGSIYELVSSYSAQDALELIQQQRFDLCFADIHMPKMDGFALIDAVREIDPGLGIVFVSAFDNCENLRRAIPLQVLEFLSKPLPERSQFEGRIPEWIERTRQRRRDLALARDAEAIAEDRDAARLMRDIELVASETARDVLQQTAGMLTTVQAHLASTTHQLSQRARNDTNLLHLLRGLEEARKTSDAATMLAERFFDSAYGSRDSSPAVPHEVIPYAIGIAQQMCRADESNKTVDYTPLDNQLPIHGLSGIESLLMFVTVLAAALSYSAPNSTVGLRGSSITRIDNFLRDPNRRQFVWLNRRQALSSHPAAVLTVTAHAAAFAPGGFEAWLADAQNSPHLVKANGLIEGIKKCQGMLGAAVAPQADRFALVLVLPT